MKSKEEILSKLNQIQLKKLEIEERITAGLTPVYDLSDTDKTMPLNDDNIQTRIIKVANDLMHDKSIDNPVLVSVMYGAFPFAAEVHKVLQQHQYHFQYETIQVSSYTGMESTELTVHANSKILKGGRDVIVVDDICDTGKTYKALKTLLLEQGARQVKLMTLIDKPGKRKKAEGTLSTEDDPSYVGFSIPSDAFIAGYGMDYDELLRNVSGIGIVNPLTLPTEEEEQLLGLGGDLNKELIQILASERVAAPKQSLYLNKESGSCSNLFKPSSSGTDVLEQDKSNTTSFELV